MLERLMELAKLGELTACNEGIHEALRRNDFRHAREFVYYFRKRHPNSIRWYFYQKENTTQRDPLFSSVAAKYSGPSFYAILNGIQWNRYLFLFEWFKSDRIYIGTGRYEVPLEIDLKKCVYMFFWIKQEFIRTGTITDKSLLELLFPKPLDKIRERMTAYKNIVAITKRSVEYLKADIEGKYKITHDPFGYAMLWLNKIFEKLEFFFRHSDRKKICSKLNNDIFYRCFLLEESPSEEADQHLKDIHLLQDELTRFYEEYKV